MRYLKLYEAFESSRLGKTLKFIKKDSKGKFLEDIKKICDRIGYPYSKLSDDNFQYLPYKAALKVKASVDDESCDETSEHAFPEYKVVGATCKDGKIKRTWGGRVREVVCPKCKGSGVKKKTPILKWIKFWFSADGDYIAISAVDGSLRSIPSGKVSGIGVAPAEVDNYDILPSISLNDTKTGDLVYLKIGGYETIATIYITPGSTTQYAIQDVTQGSEPDSDSDWKKYGRYSWCLPGDYSTSFGIHPLVPKKEAYNGENQEVDPFTWNGLFSIKYFSLQNGDLQEAIKDAHFAIVMDFDTIKNSGYELRTITKASREISRKGASFLVKDEDVKKKNIRNYIEKLASLTDISKGVSEVTKIIPRYFGGRLSIFYLYNGRNINSLNSLIDRVFNFIKSEDLNLKNRISRSIVDEIRNVYTINMDYSLKFEKAVKSIYSEIESDHDISDEKKILYKQLMDKIMELSYKISSDILNKPVENLEDLELTYQKISNIRNIMRSDRYSFYHLSNFFDRVSGYSDGYYRRLKGIPADEIHTVVSDIDKIIKIIDRL